MLSHVARFAQHVTESSAFEQVDDLQVDESQRQGHREGLIIPTECRNIDNTELHVAGATPSSLCSTLQHHLPLYTVHFGMSGHLHFLRSPVYFKSSVQQRAWV